MGWTFSRQTRNALIAERTENWTNRYGVKGETLKHCLRGNVLWTVRANTKPGEQPERYIGCDLLACRRENGEIWWGYKDMCESMHPHYYTCPMDYLNMVPTANADWRKGVLEYHLTRRKQRDLAKSLKMGDKIVLRKTFSVRNLTFFKLHPLMGMANGLVYRVPVNGIDVEATNEANKPLVGQVIYPKS